jgi:hypothetical protein
MRIAMPRLPPSRVKKLLTHHNISCVHNPSVHPRLHHFGTSLFHYKTSYPQHSSLSNMYEPPEGAVQPTTTTASDLAEITGLRDQIFGKILSNIHNILTH